MELACPSCATHFSVPDGAISAKGRKLKCSQCGHVWRQMPPETADAFDAAPARQAAAAASRPAPPPPPPPPVVEDVPPAGSVPLEMEPGDYMPNASTKQPAGDDFLSMEADPFESLRRDDANGDDDPLAGLDFGGSDDSALGDGTGSSNDFDGAELDDL
ncbi:MAG: zinc-ribbon domain-containing protein, partial [Rhodospirillaceae bacterium]